jgi:hypothetical protein
MPQYLVAVYHPDDYDRSVETEATIEKIHALNREMITAGRVAHFSRSLREVGLFADTLPTLSRRFAEFSPPTKSSR